ncbi:hypothetical protein NOF04DRAFT_1404938 [Fusarium oxysporum II5]|nr:hypothetical protein NOF04DRAFT_1404938 [Fusarium oxysporum II5]
MGGFSSRRRSASFSGGAVQQRKKIITRCRSYSIILSYGEDDGVGTAMRDWLNHPMLTSDDQLAKIITIEQCTKLSPKLEAGSVAYFRSWPMEARQFQQITEELRLHGYENSVQDWIFFLRCSDPTTRITVRYVGSRSAPRNPFKRVQKNAERPQSLLGMFLYILHKRYPEIAALHKVFTIHGTFVPDFGKLSSQQNMLSQRFHNSVTDQTERCLIAFFGFRILLNRQRGGKHGVISVDDEEERDYTRKEVWSEADKVKEANRETYITGVSAQAVAKSWLNGYSVLALCGQEPPISSINDGSGILSGIRATSSLVRSVLTLMVAMETGVCDASITSLANLFSFNQLFNWPQLAPKHKQRSRDLFDSWLETIRPLIVASLGQHVYAWVCRPSRRQTPPKSLLNEVGIPRLAQIPNSSYDAIIIPHLHPGSFARNPSMSSQDQVFWYPWVATWVYMDTAIRLLMSHDISYTSRQALCIELHIQAEATLKNAGYFESLQVAKAEFAYTKKINTLEPMICKSVAIPVDRRAVLDHHLSYSALSDQGISQPMFESTEDDSKKRPRDVFEENERFGDPRASLTSNNWGPSDKTLERWRKVYDFIRKDESLEFPRKLRNKFLLERSWTGSNSSVLPEPTLDDNNSAIAGNQPYSPIPSSLFETKSLAVHPPYRFKLALERCGKTEGPPSSTIRRQQAEQLFGDTVPKLCGWLLDKVAWVEFLQELDEGVWIAASLETARGDRVVQPERDRFIETFRGKGDAGESSNDETGGIKLQRASQQFMIQQMQWLGNITRGKVAGSLYLDLNEAEGHQIKVSQRGKVQLRFKSKNDSMVTTNIKLGPIIAPLEKDDKRTIHFTDLGIDIRTATGLTIKVPINNSACTLPLSAMKSHQNGTDFISLWKAVRGEARPEDRVSSLLKSSDEDADYPPELCVSSTGNMGEPPRKLLKTIQEPEKNDTLWLLKGYIDLRLPDGGDFWTGNKEDFPQGTDDVTGFIE